MSKAIPDGYHTVTASLTLKDGAAAIDFYQRAFGAREIMRVASPDGKIMHAEIQVGDSRIMLADEYPGMGCVSPVSAGHATSSLYLYVPDVDAAFTRAVGAGAKVVMPVTDMFWGDRFAAVDDPSGHRWGLATHVEDPSPAEFERRRQEFFASMAKK
ncbi:MAG TPA: VOC family protein [Methylomirabilota bacterium]